jgi:hypothetical protein
MSTTLRRCALWCGLPGLLAAFGLASAAEGGRLAAAERSFIDYLDANGAVAYIESGAVEAFEGRDLPDWRRISTERRRTLDADLAAVSGARVGAADAEALAAMRRTLESMNADDTTAGVRDYECKDAPRRDLDYAGLRAALVSCYTEHGNRLQYDGGTIDRGTALQLLHVVDDPAKRRAIFDAFGPLWSALNGRNEPDSPYRRMIAMAAADAAKRGSEIDAAARAIGVPTADVERWLLAVLETWRDGSGDQVVEPWDYRYSNSAANRELGEKIPGSALLPANERFYRDLGADLAQLAVVFDLAPRPDKSPLAYTDFLLRGREVDGRWKRPVARVVGTYPTGGLFSLNELVHENGHAVHVSAIRTRPAFMDWPDSLFTEAFADVPSWSVHEPAWQRKYLGVEVPEAVSLRALFSDVMLDVAWALFEIRLLRDPRADPNAVWTDITSRYLNVAPHPEVPWWAMRVQLAGSPGYMVNYGLGAVLTAEMRAKTMDVIGPFDAGNPSWYPWLSERLLRYGSERDTKALMQSLLGRPPSPGALIEQLKRARRAEAAADRPGNL